MSLRIRSWLKSFVVGAGVCVAGGAVAEGGALERSQLKEIAADDGVPAVGKLRPTWCGRVSSENYTPSALVRMTGGYFIDNAAASTIAMCVAPDDPVFQEQVGYFVQQWVNYTGQTPAQLAEYFAKITEPEKWEKLHEATCEKAAVSAESSEREQTLGEMKKAVLGCGYEAQTAKPFHYTFSLPTMKHPLWHYDRDAAPPSQLAAIYQVLACVMSADPKDMWRLGKFAGCRQDVKYLDDAALLAELKADGHNDYARIIAQQAMGTARRRAAILEAALQKKAKDPDIKAVLIDAPEKAWKEWDVTYRTNKDVIDAAHAYEDKFHGVRKSAAKGCLAGAYAALGGYMRAHAGKTVDAVLTEATSPVGAILLERVRSCNETEGRKDVEIAMAQLIEWGLPRRGPRYLAYVAMGEALSPILAERPKFAIDGQMVSADLTAPVEMGRKNEAPRWEKSGTVASVTKKGDTVHVAFKSETWTEDEVFCTETNRIAMFSADGTPIYHRNCKGTGRRVQKSSTTEPFFTYPQMSEGIAPGTFVRYRTGSNYVNKVFEGTPVEVWSGKDMKRLIATLGLAAAK